MAISIVIDLIICDPSDADADYDNYNYVVNYYW
jgi:hypothetical protein